VQFTFKPLHKNAKNQGKDIFNVCLKKNINDELEQINTVVDVNSRQRKCKDLFASNSSRKFKTKILVATDVAHLPSVSQAVSLRV
jgi:hypothetical protein